MKTPRRMKLTAASVADLSLPPGETDLLVWDETMPGFAIRLRPGDSKHWWIQYRIDGRTRRESLGDTRKVRLEDARKIAKERFAQVQLGTDPAAKRKKAVLTVAETFERYLDARNLRPTSLIAVRSTMKRWGKPLLDSPLESSVESSAGRQTPEKRNRSRD